MGEDIGVGAVEIGPFFQLIVFQMIAYWPCFRADENRPML
jgi:hypothetical protein